MPPRRYYSYVYRLRLLSLTLDPTIWWEVFVQAGWYKISNLNCQTVKMVQLLAIVWLEIKNLGSITL